MTTSPKHNSIFIVEDNSLCSFMLNAKLKEHGNYKITILDTGEKCIARLNENPDIIILDHHLGTGINGLETLKLIRSEKPELPVIILTHDIHEGLEKEIMDAGAVMYINKQNMTLALEKLWIQVLLLTSENGN
jgi:CheY-like chemotaxis protein